jgi:hypothetical protein
VSGRPGVSEGATEGPRGAPVAGTTPGPQRRINGR